jgi:hypothetical protein
MSDMSVDVKNPDADSDDDGKMVVSASAGNNRVRFELRSADGLTTVSFVLDRVESVMGLEAAIKACREMAFPK